MTSTPNYTRFYFTNRRPILVSKTLKEYEDLLLPHNFVRVHKSHMVNKQHIETLTPDGRLVLNGDTFIEISRRRKEAVLEALKK